MHGFVDAGSIEPDGRFTLVRKGAGLRVIARGTSDTFRDQAEVIVTGRLVKRDAWVLEGTVMIAKCPTKYEGEPKNLETVFR